MKHPTQQEFYEKLNEIDKENSWLVGVTLVAGSAFVIGLFLGYMIGVYI